MSSSMCLSLLRAYRAPNATRSATASLRTQARCFTTSPRHQLRAVFGEASNDDLRAASSEAQEQFILPAHLPEEQSRILYDMKKKTYIEQNPIVLEVDGLEHKFTKPLALRERPNSKKLFRTILRNLSTKEDVANVPTLLAGYKKAGIVLKPNQFGQLTSAAAGKDGLDILVDCARHARETGYLLTVDRSGFMVLEALAQMAHDGENEKATKMLEQVLDILEREPHSDLPGHLDLRSSKIARGLMASIRLADLEASQSSSDSQRNALSDDIELLRAMWTKAIEKKEGHLVTELNERCLLLFGDGSKTAKANKSTSSSSLSPYPMAKMIARSIRTFEVAPTLLGQPCDPLPEASRLLEEYLARMATEAKDNAGSEAVEFKSLASGYKEVLGRAPSWA